MRTTILVLVTLLLATLIVSGCGGGGSVTPPPAGSISFSHPPVGADGKISGQVTGATWGSYWVSIYQDESDGWWGPIQVNFFQDGSFHSTNPVETTATMFFACIHPPDYSPPFLTGGEFPSVLLQYPNTDQVPR